MGVLMFKHIFFRSFLGFHATLLLFPVCLTQDYTAFPIFPNASFLWAWNVAIHNCVNFSIKIDLSLFSLSGSPGLHRPGQGVVIFYKEKLGHYPYVHKGNNVSGGIPQLANLQSHLDQARKDICGSFRPNDVGLAVIDWEEWRPLWERNWVAKAVYKNQSIDLVLQKNKTLNSTYAELVAKAEFEKAGRDFMLETLELGLLLRPKYLWGFYLFPDCYNHRYEKERAYNGSCLDKEKENNDLLDWLWKGSTALYPSIYLNTRINGSNTALFARNRVLEALRVSKVRNNMDPLPVFVYFRLVFTDKIKTFLSEDDLVHTIGESVALGASGMVIWGSSNLTRNQTDCTNLANFMKNTLNRYIINVTLAAKMCSQVLCQDQGVCIRRNWNSSDYLHLNPKIFTIQILNDGKYVVKGKPTQDDLQQFYQKFHCSCYANIRCMTRVNVTTTNLTPLCVGNNICIDAFVNSALSGPSKLSGISSGAYSSAASTIPYTTMSPCASGKDLNESLQTKCLVEAISNILQEEHERTLCNLTTPNETTFTSTSSMGKITYSRGGRMFLAMLSLVYI
ncbi:hyaluronidase PH-20-like [Talpa occidentalis]|uniref:hyaluronidase PH-20-like n=1 Tax=Talpa occidentalis TaxID=50954 RepID=UPI00188F2033|nr:hyaluronidase PH-20-like [Talpa occidentalis]XP_054548592.1 hyaluronidase PH-20-like [Talpa occidentalis]XP_054548593.1 hyaluronidase PH-20-like [Talpa occidentalis]XP_054548594.1 hyaluronidase PH-20-like [Talpa occidentalis]XP_054548595.1 hyaluronidase PH-20-like [Talpa occidentalis]XP_054548596.1 hyaluronidase PH-20-like [Talpa occidentalis]